MGWKWKWTRYSIVRAIYIVQREYFDHCPRLSQTVRDNLRHRAFLEFYPVLRAVFEAAGTNDHAQHFYPITREVFGVDSDLCETREIFVSKNWAYGPVIPEK